MACVKGVLVVTDCPFCEGSGIVEDQGWSHPGRGYRADYPRTLGDGLIDCGGCGGDGVVPDDPAEALRAVIAKAIDDLGTHTRVENLSLIHI